MICCCEILVVYTVLKSSLEFSALVCLQPALASKSSNRIPASYGNWPLRLKKTNYIYAITKLYTLTSYCKMVFAGHRIIQGSHSLEKSLNSIFP